MPKVDPQQKSTIRVSESIKKKGTKKTKVSSDSKIKKETNNKKVSKKTKQLKKPILSVRGQTKDSFLTQLNQELKGKDGVSSIPLGKTITLRNRLGLAVLSPYRFPIKPDNIAITVARLTGMFFLLIGSALSVANLYGIYSESAVVTVLQSNPTQSASVLNYGDKNSPTESKISDYLTADSGLSPKLDVQQKQQNEYQFRVLATNAYSVNIKLVNTDNGEIKTLGPAQRVSEAEWIYILKTEDHSFGTYAVYADIVGEQKITTDKTKISIDETRTNESAELDENVETSLDPQNLEVVPEITDTNLSIEVPQEVSGFTEIIVHTGADKVEIYAEPASGTGSRYIGRARLMDGNKWSYLWNSANMPDGGYNVYAKTTQDSSIQTTKASSVTIKNGIQYPVTGVVPTTETQIPTEVASHQTLLSKLNERRKALLEKVDQEARVHISQTDQDLANWQEKYLLAQFTDNSYLNNVVKDDLSQLRKSIVVKTLSSERTYYNQMELDVINYINLLKEDTMSLAQELISNYGQSLSTDSDRDGLTDWFEDYIYLTNPTMADSDRDGFIDGVEIINNFDPLSDKSEVVLQYDPDGTKALIEEGVIDITKLVPVELLDDKDGAETKKRSAVVIKGHSIPNSFLFIEIIDGPIVATTVTDKDGNWQYLLDKELPSGAYEITAGLINNQGDFIYKTDPYSLTLSEDGVFDMYSLVGNTTASYFESDSTVVPNNRWQGGAERFVASLMIVILGLLLLILAMHLNEQRQAKRSYASPIS